MDEMRRLRSFETPAQKTKRKARSNAKRNKNKVRFTLRTAAAPAASDEA
jgi:ribosomal protein S21